MREVWQKFALIAQNFSARKVEKLPPAEIARVTYAD